MKHAAVPGDTDPEVYTMLADRWRSMTIDERVALIEQMCDDVDVLARAGILAEPRSTVDVDVAISPGAEREDALLDRAAAQFYVQLDGARAAMRDRSSFNLVDTRHGLKVDLFVLGDGLLDRMQIERRIEVAVPGAAAPLWVTSPEDQVLRKLEWFQIGGSTSDRQWRDVIGILRNQCGQLDLDYLTTIADEIGMTDLLNEALAQE